MKISTVRARLILWHVAALGTILLLFSFGVYALFAKTLHDRLDGKLRSAEQVTELALNHEIEEHGGREPGEASVRDVLRTMHQTSFPDTAIAVWDHGRLVAEKSGRQGIDASLLPPGTFAEPGLRTVQINNRQYRLIVSDVSVPFIAATYRVTANESLQDVEVELANVRYVLLLSVPLCVILSAAGGYFLARKSLRPVSDMAQTLEHISSANLNQRLTIHNPSDEFGRLGETFNGLLDRLAQAFRQQQQFMADASHELRTPLSVALTATQFTLKKPDRDTTELRDALTLVEEQLWRLKRIVEDMFILAQADAGAYQPSISPLYLTDLADEAMRAAKVLAQAKGIAIRNNRPDQDYEFEGDEGLLRQLMLILLDNAVKHTPSGGQVELRLHGQDGGYVLEVSDTGTGIAEADLPFIFDRFYRGDMARSRRDPGAGSGAGLGLAIAKWITELHGGAISASSTPAGTTFRVWLPYARNPRVAAAAT